MFDERFTHTDSQGDPYGRPSRDAQAGDRVPDSPDLQASGITTRLFDLFTPTAHTVLVFTSLSTIVEASSMLGPLKTLVSGVTGPKPINIPYIHPKGVDSDSLGENTSSGGQIYVDASGHAFSGFSIDPSTATPTLVIVCPDGMIGAFAASMQGVEMYVDIVFNS